MKGPCGREVQAIEDCSRGRLGGLEFLYEEYRLRVFRTCLRLLGERAAAEDATQEVFLRVFDRIASFDRRAAFSTWLYRLTVNHCLNDRERTRRRATVPMDGIAPPIDPAALPEGACARRESETHLLRALAELGAQHRTILVLREIEDLSYGEIAGVLEVPVGTVMSRLARARDAFRAVWTARHAPVSGSAAPMPDEDSGADRKPI